MSNLNASYWSAIERVFAYIKGTPTRGPTYTKGSNDFQGYTDSDWAGNIADRKSTSGHIFLLQGAPISWRSKRQTSIALSNAEAEYIAASEAAKEALYLRLTLNTFFLMEKQIQTVILKEDNESCILIGSNPELHQRTKHIDMRYHFLRDHIKKGDIALEWTPTTDQLANGLTKPLAAAAFNRFVRGIKLTNRLPDESSLNRSVRNQQPLTRHAANEGCVGGFY